MRSLPFFMHVSPAVLAFAALAAAQGRGPIRTPKERLANHARHIKMLASSPFRDFAWKPIGPTHMSGRITGVAVPAGRPFTFYVATASGGLWKTVNEGTTWRPIFENAPSAACGAVACAPSAPDTVWLGTGEANIFRSSMSGTGIYKSSDAGKTWHHMGLAPTHTIARIVVHPKDPDIVWVAASGHEWTPNEQRGIYKTTNGGSTWERVLYVDDHTGAIDLVLDPKNPNRLYAAMWERTRKKWSDPKPGSNSGIWRSNNGGKTWERVTKGLPPPSDTGRIGLAVAASKPHVVYALIDNHELARKARKGELDSYGRPKTGVIKGAEVYRSDDRGGTWNRVSQSKGDSGRRLRRLFSTYGWVFGQIRVDPTNSDLVYVLGVGLLRSRDGGRTFDPVRFPGLHGDNHELWLDPTNPRHLISGNDGGINISYDGGETWKNDESLPVVQCYNVAYDFQEPFHVYCSIQDNNSWMGPITHVPGRSPASEWQRCPGGEASYHQIDPSNDNVLYSESFYGRIQRSTLSPRKTVSIVPKRASGQPRLRGQWLAPFQISPHNPFVIYHGMQYVFRSMDRGKTWTRISPDLSYNDPAKRGDISFQTITSISESPKRFGLLYAGTDDGRLHVTRNAGKSWTEITHGLPTRKWVSRVIASRWSEPRVWVAQNGKRDDDFQAWLFRSDDYGHSWSDTAGTIPGGPINVVKEDPRDEKILWVGTDLGVYVSIDRGKTFVTVGKQLPITFVHDLFVHPRDDVLVVATHGRGCWKLDLSKIRKAIQAKRKSKRKAKPPHKLG